MTKPFAYIAIKDNCWGGVCSLHAGDDSLADWFIEFARAGFDFKAYGTKEEYQAALKSMEIYTAQKAGVVD